MSDMQPSTPEDRAAEFARRWFGQESKVMRDMATREIARLLREASRDAVGAAERDNAGSAQTRSI
jgi:hypothetical protein